MLKNTKAFSSLSVDDIKKAKEFYGKTLDLKVKETMQGLDLTLPNGSNVFIYPKPNHIPATFTVLNFKVDNIDKAVSDLKQIGIQIELYDTKEMKADNSGIYRGKAVGQGPDIAWFKDPAGNVLSVLEE